MCVRVMSDHREDPRFPLLWFTGFFAEVLLSYRLVFGQTKRSRKAFGKQRPFPAGDGFSDPVLSVLCGRKSSITETIKLDELFEKDAYNVNDFPCLGARLTLLQQHVVTHKSNKIKDRWRDRSNKSEWTAYWFILILAFLALVASLVQIGLSGAQIQLTLHPQSSSD